MLDIEREEMREQRGAFVTCAMLDSPVDWRPITTQRFISFTACFTCVASDGTLAEMSIWRKKRMCELQKRLALDRPPGTMHSMYWNTRSSSCHISVEWS